LIDTPRARVRTVAGVALICAALVTGCGRSPAVPGTADGATTAASPAAPTDPESYAAELFRLTNELRAREGLPLLAGSTCAEDVAVERASALIGAESLEHAPMDDVLARCAPSTHAAENLGRAEATPAEVVTAWEGSFGHLENLLSETASSLGVGCVPDGAELLCSQIFLGP
jgi:uncharacterized protein YkwD